MVYALRLIKTIFCDFIKVVGRFGRINDSEEGRVK